MTYDVLFVDDEPEFVRPQIAALEAANYTVTLETDPDRVIALLSRRSFDLIILDLSMPSQRESTGQADLSSDLSGMILHEVIRCEAGLVTVPIIFLTVVRDHAVRERLRQREETYGQSLRYLTKPTLPSEVVAEVRKALMDRNK